MKVITAVFNWLAERLRDLSMWPINLVRDFPVRVTRLARTVWGGIGGIITFLPSLVRAAAGGNLGDWFPGRVGRFFNWFHLFLTQIFDLCGGPELGEFVLHFFARTTPLTSAEIAMISGVLGEDALRFGDVRVVEGGLFDWIFKMNGNLAFATWHSINLPRTGGHTRKNLPIVVHELTHVFQYENVGSRYLGEAIYMLIKTKRDCYNYGGGTGLQDACAVGKCYCDFNREQQAKITQDFYDLTTQGKDVTAYEPFITQVRAREI
ncbi:MAG: hypothetical protein CSB13_04210 [Chloroflexi bacterium]|nr:MAG: hypothetical protein CSB13_04210 [Chloroflexota bacterium]